jgi:hypothetical protein
MPTLTEGGKSLKEDKLNGRLWDEATGGHSRSGYAFLLGFLVFLA